MERPFVFNLDSSAIKAVGAPIGVAGQAVFNELVEETKTLITDGAGDILGLKVLISQKMTELATARFEEAQSEVPEAIQEAINDDAKAISDALSENLSFAMVATLINFFGKSHLAMPIISFAMTPVEVANPASPPVPLVANATAVPQPV